MNTKILFALWGVLFIICAALGFMPEADYPLMALLFFVPPAVLLYRAGKQGDRACAKLICWLSALSLGLTVALLAANLLSVTASESLGTALYFLLVMVSSPMVCSGYWAVSLFFWAGLLMASLRQLKKTKRAA